MEQEKVQHDQDIFPPKLFSKMNANVIKKMNF